MCKLYAVFVSEDMICGGIVVAVCTTRELAEQREKEYRQIDKVNCYDTWIAELPVIDANVQLIDWYAPAYTPDLN